MAEIKTEEIIRNETPLLSFAVKDNDGNAFDLTGYTATLSAKKELTDADTVFSIGVTIDDATNGLCSVRLSKTQTAVAQLLICELEIVKASPVREFTPIQFYLNIIDDVKPT